MEIFLDRILDKSDIAHFGMAWLYTATGDNHADTTLGQSQKLQRIRIRFKALNYGWNLRAIIGSIKHSYLVIRLAISR